VGRFTVNGAGSLVVNALGVIRAPEQGPAEIAHATPSPAGASAAGGEAFTEAMAADAPTAPIAGPVFTLRRTTGRSTALLPVVPTTQTLMHHPGHTEIDQRQDGLLGDFSTRPICGPDAAGSNGEMVKIRATRFPDLVAQHQHASREVMIRQTLLQERGRVLLGGECRSVVFDASDGPLRMVVVTAGSVEIYDLSDLSAPRAAEAWQVDGVRGAVVFGGKLLLWGDRGIWVAGDPPPARPPFSRCDESAVRGAVALGDRMYVLRAGTLRVYSTDLCELDRCDSRAEQIAAAGQFLAAREAREVRFFAAAEALEKAVAHPLCGVSHVETPALASGDAVYARGPDGGFLLTAAGERLAEWEGGAWFEGVVRSGRLLAFPDGQLVRLLEATRTEQSE
jgi:hypothetical protein